MTIKTILVPLDFGEASASVVDFARLLANATSASLHLLHVINCALPSSRTVEEQRDDAQRRLDGVARALNDRRHPTTTSCEIGTPAEAIVRFAHDHQVDAIVMGTHCHGPTFRMATGSIADRVLGAARCTVVAVKCPEHGAGDWADPPVTEAVI